MSKWLKNILNQLSAKLNADDDFDKEETKDAANTTSSNSSSKGEERLDNMEELKEVTLGAITNTVRMLGYGKPILSGVRFHSRFKDNAVKNVGLQALVKDDEFVKRIRREFKAKGIKYKEDFFIDIVHNSSSINKVTKITDGIGVEVLTPEETQKKSEARLVATEGITWEPEYILQPTGKQYYIGRCKNPKIENGPKIQNDIAFVGVEEKDEAQYKINNYISRSHASLVFDKDMGAWKIYRSKFLNNPAHKIKIYNTSLNDFSGVNLNQSTVPHVLKHGDSICFNDKVVLEFYLLGDMHEQ